MVRTSRFALAPIVGSILLALACGPQPGGVTILDAYVLDPLGSDRMAFYATVKNGGPDADTLLSLSSEVAEGAGSFHRMSVEDGFMKMRPTGPLAIGAGETLRLVPGELHGMFPVSGVHPGVGDTIDVALEFAGAGTLTVRASVRDPGRAGGS